MKRPLFMLLTVVFTMFLTSLAKQVSGVQAAHDLTVRNMNITGEIALVRHGYIIRGKVPAEIFTILNPDPKVLDKFVTSGKTVKIQVRIVSGDNVEIVKLAGMNYLDETSGAQSVQDCTVRIMSITGEIAQASNGYIIRGSVPAEVFTILNPDPKILDKFVTSGKTVKIQVRIVSGGNVEIKMIDGKKYLNKSQ